LKNEKAERLWRSFFGHLCIRVAILFGQHEADAFTELICRSDECSISTGNYLELTMVLHGQPGSNAGRQADTFFRRAGIEVEPLSPWIRLTPRGRHSSILARAGIRRG
jgi:hypothetical protein